MALRHSGINFSNTIELASNDDLLGTLFSMAAEGQFSPREYFEFDRLLQSSDVIRRKYVEWITIVSEIATDDSILKWNSDKTQMLLSELLWNDELYHQSCYSVRKLVEFYEMRSGKAFDFSDTRYRSITADYTSAWLRKIIGPRDDTLFECAETFDMASFWPPAREGDNRDAVVEVDASPSSEGNEAKFDATAVASTEYNNLLRDQQMWISRYQKIGKRDSYLWWKLRFSAEQLTLSTVEDKWIPKVRHAKFLVGMLNCLVDDVVNRDRSVLQYQRLLLLLCDSPPLSAGFQPEEQLMALASDLWSELWTLSKEFPRFVEFRSLLVSDLSRMIESLDHSQMDGDYAELLSQNQNVNHTPKGTIVPSAATLDLMASPAFDLGDWPILLRLLGHAEQIVRSGTVVGSWKSDFGEGDFSNVIVAEALRRGVITQEQLREGKRDVLLTQISESGIEVELLIAAREACSRIEEVGGKMKSVDTKRYTASVAQVFGAEVFSYGEAFPQMSII